MKVVTSRNQKLGLIIIGIVLALAFIEIGMRLTGFVITQVQDFHNIRAAKKEGHYRILCLGESTTMLGWGQSYPAQLEKILNEKNIGVTFSVINGGVVGTNTTNILTDLEDNLEEYSPDLVITMLGVNDGRKDVMPKNVPNIYKKGLTYYLRKLKTYRLIRHILLHSTAKYNSVQISALEQDPFDAIEENPDLSKEEREHQAEIIHYLDLADEQIDALDFDEARKILKKVFKLDPDNAEANRLMGSIYAYHGDTENSMAFFTKAIESDPRNEEAYANMISKYYFMQRYDIAEEVALKMLRNIPDSQEAIESLAQIYFMKQDDEKLRNILQDAEKKCPHSYLISKIKASYHLTNKEYKLSGKMFKRADQLAIWYTTEVTIFNYQRIKEIILGKGLKLMCVQYPMRNLSTLKKMLVPYDGVIFVDNERIFKEAIKQKSYSHYFADNFAGDFGHLSSDGNELLAENIADAIFKKIF